MSSLVRFGISIEKDLLDRFDHHIRKKQVPTRSKAISDLIQHELIHKKWTQSEEVAGTLTLVFDHHKKDLVSQITDIQHQFHFMIISSQHIHLDHDNCLEVVIVKGNPDKIQKLADQLGTIKGLSLASLNVAAITTSH